MYSIVLISKGAVILETRKMLTINDLSISEQIDWYARRIIVASIQYYELDKPTISDRQYDELSKKLCGLITKATEEEFKKCQYYCMIYDFDGSTGFDLPHRLNEKDKSYLTHLARIVG